MPPRPSVVKNSCSESWALVVVVVEEVDLADLVAVAAAPPVAVGFRVSEAEPAVERAAAPAVERPVAPLVVAVVDPAVAVDAVDNSPEFPLVNGQWKYKHEAQASLESGKKLTRWRFVLVLLARQDVKDMTER
jgi:hypothetical protein